MQWKSKPIITGKDLIACEELIKQAGEEYVACEVKSETVILYRAVTEASYYKSPEGKIFPNGSFKEAGHDRGGKWHGPFNANHRTTAYRVGFVAVCREKTTYIRSSNTKAEYKYHPKGLGEYGKLLESFCAITVTESEMKEIPYTEEAAKFFYETMMGLCHLADRIDSFFNDDEALANAIQGQTPVLLAAH